MKIHRNIIAAQLGLPKYARFECIASRLAIESDFIAHQYAYRVYVGHEMIKAMLIVIDYEETGEQKIRVENQTGSLWKWMRDGDRR